MTSQRAEQIRLMLKSRFATARIAVKDDSARHAGHAGARSGAGHFMVRIESEEFSGRSRLQRHRLVYEALASMLPREIHALNIVAVSPDDDIPSRTP